MTCYKLAHFLFTEAAKIPLDCKLVSHGKLDQYESKAYREKNEQLKAAWADYELAKESEEPILPFGLLKKIQSIVKPLPSLDDDYLNRDPDLTDPGTDESETELGDEEATA